jgi:hypothetical protein
LATGGEFSEAIKIMDNLTLHLKAEYFNEIKSGEKTEEYRLVTPYWEKRLDGRNYNNIILCSGYPARNDNDRRIVRRWNGCKKKIITHKFFGDNPVVVYAIDVSRI